MTMDSTRLLTGTALTPADIRGADFPMAIIGGYRTADVEAFRDRVYRAMAQLHRALDERAVTEQELTAEVQRLTQMLENGPNAQAQAGAQSAGRILTLAQQNADNLLADARTEAGRIVGEARHTAEQLTARAQQEAAELRERVHGEAEEERAQVIEQASAEGRAVASAFRGLSEEMGQGLTATLETLRKQVTEWDQRAAAGQAPPRAAAASRRRSGPQPQASAKPATA